MNKIKSFLQLDFVTIKPYIIGKNLLIYVAIALFLTITSGSISSGLFVGMMLGTLLISYSFAVGEKSNMDTLYVTLAVNRKTVVLGRYVFVFLLNICLVAFVYLIASVGLPLARIAGVRGDEAGDVLWMGVLLAALFAVIQAIQLPIFFKYSYTKAKLISIVPFAVIAAASTAFSAMGKDHDLVNRAADFVDTLNHIWLITCAALILVILMFGSYKLSLAFYQKREF